MTAFKHWLATLSVFAIGGITQAYVQPAEAHQVPVVEIERACERALTANTIEALEEFFMKYPPEQYRNDVACYALALGALNEFGRQNDDSNPPSGGRPGDGGYGQ